MSPGHLDLPLFSDLCLTIDRTEEQRKGLRMGSETDLRQCRGHRRQTHTQTTLKFLSVAGDEVWPNVKHQGPVVAGPFGWNWDRNRGWLSVCLSACIRWRCSTLTESSEILRQPDNQPDNQTDRQKTRAVVRDPIRLSRHRTAFFAGTFCPIQTFT